MTNYVVGLLGSDGYLGRTIACETHSVAIEAIGELFDDNGDSAPQPEHWDDECTFVNTTGTYFFGGLENPDLGSEQLKAHHDKTDPFKLDIGGEG